MGMGPGSRRQLGVKRPASYRQSRPSSSSWSNEVAKGTFGVISELSQLIQKYSGKDANTTAITIKVEEKKPTMVETVPVSPIGEGGTRRSARVPKRKRLSLSPGPDQQQRRKKLTTLGNNCQTPTKLEVDCSELETVRIESREQSLKVPLPPITEEYFKGKEEFGAAVMIIIEGDSRLIDFERMVLDEGYLVCGLCHDIQKIRNFNSYKKHGAYICLACFEFYQKMVKIAKKALAFECSSGNGSCLISPGNKYCESCFIITVLMLLELSDVIYFKLWIAIPPFCKANVPCTPPSASEKRHPYRGKILFVNREGGSIVNISSKNFSAKDIKAPEAQEKKGRKPIGKVIVEAEKSVEKLGKKLKIEKKTDTNKTAKNDEESREMQLEDTLLKIFPSSSSAATSSGYPVVTAIGSEPPKALCLSCGSAGINQLIFCCVCSQPFHAYCSDDKLLESAFLSHTYQPSASTRECLVKKLEKWKCQRCVSCRKCGLGEGNGEFIGCSSCYGYFHFDCAKKMPVRPTDRKKTNWVCVSCLKCTSCQIPIKSGRSSHHRKVLNEKEDADILCLECFRRRQKGSFCPVCMACYDDNDWGSKMMECDLCQRWIHAYCEKLCDEEYFLLSSLPESIPYICRLCQDPMPNVGWRMAITSEMQTGCFKILDLFHKKILGASRKRRALSFDCDNISNSDETTAASQYFTASSSELKVERTLMPIKKEFDECLSRRFNIKPCAIILTDMNVLSCHTHHSPPSSGLISSPPKISPKLEELKTPTKIKTLCTQFLETPTKVSTPSRVASSFIDVMKQYSGWKTVKDFRLQVHSLLPSHFSEMTSSGKYEGEERVRQYFEDTLKEVFGWWRDDLLEAQVKKVEEFDEEEEDTASTLVDSIKDEFLPNAIIFEDIYWDRKIWMDSRACELCGERGDFPDSCAGRLLYVSPEEWAHINCLIWSSEVWEEDDGSLQQVDSALLRGRKTECNYCQGMGASINCCAASCRVCFHFLCASAAGCRLETDKSVFCSIHSHMGKGEVQKELHVTRKVFINQNNGSNKRKEVMRLKASAITIIIGGIRVDRLGHLLPISFFPSSDLLLPVNLHLSLVQLSSDPKHSSKILEWRTILDKPGDFRSNSKLLQSSDFNLVINHSKPAEFVKRKTNELEQFTHWTTVVDRFVDEFNEEWTPSYNPPTRQKRKSSLILEMNLNSKIHRAAIVWKPQCEEQEMSASEWQRMEKFLTCSPLRFFIQQLPGTDEATNLSKQEHSSQFYQSFGPTFLNASGCSRSERFVGRKPYDMFSWLRSKHRRPVDPSSFSVSEENIKVKGQGLPIPMRFRNLKESRGKALIVLPSDIHGRGLFARRNIEVGELLIEYAGEMIRAVLCDLREQYYEARGIGCYMFRMNKEHVIDATLKGNAARFINHSCEPNCESKVVKVLGKNHILIFALTNIARGEELTYDYKFEREADKLPCLCRSRKCRRFLN